MATPLYWRSGCIHKAMTPSSASVIVPDSFFFMQMPYFVAYTIAVRLKRKAERWRGKIHQSVSCRNQSEDSKTLFPYECSKAIKMFIFHDSEPTHIDRVCRDSTWLKNECKNQLQSISWFDRVGRWIWHMHCISASLWLWKGCCRFPNATSTALCKNWLMENIDLI